jgi:hypothetical protein
MGLDDAFEQIAHCFLSLCSRPSCFAIATGLIGSAQGLERRYAVHLFVRGGEPSEVGEPPAVRDGGDGAAESITARAGYGIR